MARRQQCVISGSFPIIWRGLSGNRALFSLAGTITSGISSFPAKPGYLIGKQQPGNRYAFDGILGAGMNTGGRLNLIPEKGMDLCIIGRRDWRRYALKKPGF